MTEAGDIRYELTLFVSGATEHSAHAITNAKALCEAHLRGRHRLSFVDLHDDPGAALRNQVVVAPTLVRHSPLPVCRVVGDLSDTETVLAALGLPDTTLAT